MQTPERADLLPLLADLDGDRFEEAAEAVFRYQAAHNPLYARYLELLGRTPSAIHRPPSTVYRLPSTVYRPPFLPIRFFKTQKVTTGSWTPQTVFTSSATTGQTPSRHLVCDLEFYVENARRGFAYFYGDPSEWRILALLPSYLERGGSSLVAMADHFIRLSRYPESGFFLDDFQRLRDVLLSCRSDGYKTLLLGVSFALLDFAERFPMDLSGITVMETGGMKGRRREITRPELHEMLCSAFQLTAIHSEYGMTELFSQAYAQGGSLFTPAPTMRVMATEINDPFCPVAPGRTGVLNIIDLANLDTCSFIQTEDVGKVYADGRFEVLGRLDVAEMRGCNLMVE
ncbi:MAG: acyl transferase [Haliscomenobacteraceae bacterium CHB4]|nr:acyl transferase [Haliscomenobacteraceae bacterium CHB4]